MHIIANIFWFSIVLAFVLQTACLPLSNKVDNLNSGNQTIQTTAATTAETTSSKNGKVILIVLKTMLSLLGAAVSQISVWVIAAFCIYKGTYQITKLLKEGGAKSFNIKENNSCNYQCCFTCKVCCSSCVCFCHCCFGGSNDMEEGERFVVQNGDDEWGPYVELKNHKNKNMAKLDDYDVAYEELHKKCPKINFHKFLQTYEQYLQKSNMSHVFHCKRDKCKKLKHKNYELLCGLGLEPVIYFLVFDWNKLLSKNIQTEKDLFNCWIDDDDTMTENEWNVIIKDRKKNVFVTLLNFPQPGEISENIMLRNLVVEFFGTLKIANANIVHRVIKYHNAGSGNHHFTVSKNDLKTFPNGIKIEPKTSKPITITNLDQFTFSQNDLKTFPWLERIKIYPKPSKPITIANVEDTENEIVIKIKFDPKESYQKKFWFRISVNKDCSVKEPYLESQTNTSSTSLTSALDMIVQGICDIKRFADALELGNFLIGLPHGDEWYHKYKKIQKCIDEKKQTSEVDLDWWYWRSILLQLHKEDLIRNIEQKYPCLHQDKLLHRATAKQFGILAHGASEILFDKVKKNESPITMKKNIKISIGAGGFKMLEVNELPTTQDIYFDKHVVLGTIKKFDFSNIMRNKECKVLQTVSTWLHNNDDDNGFCIKGYDAKKHLEFLSEDYKHDNLYTICDILVYSKNNNVILSIDINPDDITKSRQHNCSNIRFLCSSNECLDEISFVYIPITLYDRNKHKIDEQLTCERCNEMELLVPFDIFKHLESFTKWWENISIHVDNLKRKINQKSINSLNLLNSNEFFKSIMTFMACDLSYGKFELPSFIEDSDPDPEDEITEAAKVIMLTPEQQNIVYSTSKHKIIKGPYGSGKTIVAQKILKLVASDSTESDKAYYILHDNDSGLVNDMKEIVKSLKSNIICCRRSDLVKGDNLLSSILKKLLEINKDKSIHVFIEEFNAEVLNKKEIKKIQDLLKQFENSHIVLVAQSMESKRSETNNELSAMHYETYQYNKLTQDTDFEMFELSYLLRSSLHINDIVNAAIPILEKAKINTTIPKLAPQTNPKVVSSNSSATTPSIKQNLDMTRSSSSGITTEISKQPSITRKDDTMFDDSMNDNDKLLKQCSIMTANDNLKKQIESSYTFVGSGKNGHNVKGTKPVIYYPFCKEGKKFSYQMYCFSEVMKEILKDKKKKQVIICLNTESFKMVKFALEVNGINWTNDYQSLSKSVCLLTEYTAVRGCEFTNVVLIYPNDERYLKHHIVDCINRCKLNLDIVVFKKDVPDDTLVAILDEWIDEKLVSVANLKNFTDADLETFEKVHNDTLTKLKEEEKIDVNNPNVIQKLILFESLKDDTKHDEVGTVEEPALKDISQASNNDEEVRAPASYAVFQVIWKTCEEASLNHNRSLLMEALHRNNLDVNAIYNMGNVIDFKRSLLHYAAMFNDVDVVKFLCSIDNIDVNTRNEVGNTPLMLAAWCNNIDVVRVLLDMNNIDVNITDRWGVTALEYATSRGYNEIVDLLNNSS